MRTPAEINEANAAFWKEATERFNNRIAERPSDIKRALRTLQDEYRRHVAAGSHTKDAMAAMPSVESLILELEDHEKEGTAAKNSTRGILSAKVRKELTSPIREIIRKVRAESPGLTQEDTARKVSSFIAAMPARPYCPGIRQLVRMISEMEKEGEIPT